VRMMKFGGHSPVQVNDASRRASIAIMPTVMERSSVGLWKPIPGNRTLNMAVEGIS
jgi:hypothetical protein